MSLWRSFKTTQCRRQRLLTSVFTSLNAVQYEQLDSEAATQCTKRANSMNVSRSFFVFGMDSALAFHGLMFYETEETAPQSS